MERRKRRSQGEWNRIIGEQRQSGLTAAAFCRKAGIGVMSFYQWKRRLSETVETNTAKESEAFIELGRVEGPVPSVVGRSRTLVVTVDLGDGARLTVERV